MSSHKPVSAKPGSAFSSSALQTEVVNESELGTPGPSKWGKKGAMETMTKYPNSKNN